MPVMPPEWEPHARTWMAFPPDSPTSADLDAEGLLSDDIAYWKAAARDAKLKVE